MIPYEKNPQQFLGIVAAGVALLATAYVVWDLLEVAGGHGENPYVSDFYLIFLVPSSTYFFLVLHTTSSSDSCIM